MEISSLSPHSTTKEIHKFVYSLNKTAMCQALIHRSRVCSCRYVLLEVIYNAESKTCSWFYLISIIFFLTIIHMLKCLQACHLQCQGLCPIWSSQQLYEAGIITLLILPDE